MLLGFGLVLTIIGILVFLPHTPMWIIMLIGGVGALFVGLVHFSSVGGSEGRTATTLLERLLDWRIIVALLVLIILLMLVNAVVGFTDTIEGILPGEGSWLPDLPDIKDLNPFIVLRGAFAWAGEALCRLC